MIDSVAFVGLGSVGAIYAQPASRCGEVPCFAVVREKESFREKPVRVNGERLDIPLRLPEEVSKPADLILIAVKWHALPDALEQVAPAVGERTIVLSLLNGISSERVIAARFGQARVLYAFGSGIDSNRSGRDVCMNRRGKIVFGSEAGEEDEDVAAVRAYFERAGIPHEVSPDMLRQMWWKLMVNVGMNQVSAVMNLNFGAFRRSGEAMNRMRMAQREVIAVANAQGILLDERDMAMWERQLEGLSADGMSSTLQDVRAGRKTEVELYGGEICRLGALLGVPTPVNAELVRRICEIERSF
ncbi:MAG: ketopantoate reductase family protein [Clostridia bacterium]|nr:ketopantoate reductase family protein [Clostridia bacterium]